MEYRAGRFDAAPPAAPPSQLVPMHLAAAADATLESGGGLPARQTFGVPPPRRPGASASRTASREAAPAAAPLSQWSVQRVVAWLCSELGMAEHGSNFRKAQVDGLTLPHLDAAALGELGVTAPLQQRELLEAARALAAAEPAVSGLVDGARRVRSWATQEVSRWLAEVVGLPRYCPAWEATAIDGTVLLCLDRSSLAELGVASALHRSLLLAEVERLHHTLAPMESTPHKQQLEPEPEPELEGVDAVVGMQTFEEEVREPARPTEAQRGREQQARAEAHRWQQEQEQQARDEERRWEQEQEQRRVEMERKQARQMESLRRTEQQQKRQRQQRHQEHEEQQQMRERQHQQQQQDAGLSLSVASPKALPPPAAAAIAPSGSNAPYNLPTPLSTWDAGDVGGWIARSVRLPQYASAFVKQEIDGSLLAVLDDDSLCELGVGSAFHRLKIIHGVQKLRTTSAGNADAPAGADDDGAVFSVPSWGTPVRNPGTSTGVAATAIRAARLENAAATTVQAAERGRQVRRCAREEAEAATRLQSVARGRAVRAAQAREAAAATVLQRATRERAERIAQQRLERTRQQSVKPLVAWSVAEVTSWLEHTCGLGQYVALFEQHEVDGTLLSYLDKPSLEELGVPSALHRLKLLTALGQLPAVQHSLAEMDGVSVSDAPAVASGATARDVRRSTLALDLDRDLERTFDGSVRQCRQGYSANQNQTLNRSQEDAFEIQSGSQSAGSVVLLPPVYVSSGLGEQASAWSTARDTPPPALRLVPPTPAAWTSGAAGASATSTASPQLQDLEQFQQQQQLMQEQQQEQQGVLGGLMRYQVQQQQQQQSQSQSQSLSSSSEALRAENEALRHRLEEVELLLAGAGRGIDTTATATATVPSPELPEGVPPTSATPATAAAAAAAASSSSSSSSSLAAFLSPWYDQLCEDLDALGVEAVDDFRELDSEDLEALASKLKKVPARKFLKHVMATVGIADGEANDI
jgi:hypothetical protein